MPIRTRRQLSVEFAGRLQRDTWQIVQWFAAGTVAVAAIVF